ncbi:alpha/beta hydrolase [Labrenzia suaedae]|uniref:Alpha/beta hydrolase n=2 Tax=Roseibium litorale TaxID=2803841 RepID=A0ABR9CP78_9HYPH|nr:alpha/beta hydrolase [Roseibium litorale]
MAKGFGYSFRAPLLKTPADYGLDFEDVTFASEDGVPLEAWYIPCPGSAKLIIANHPRWFNRYGCPTHIEPWRSLGAWADPGNTIEVNYVPDYRILHDAGYNVLTYDERNFGQSGDANGGVTSAGRFEARDVIGSLLYARKRAKNMTIGLFSRCNGANATFYAMHTQPEQFADVRCLVAAQPLSVRSVVTRSLTLAGLIERIDDFEQECKLITTVGFDDMSPIGWVDKVQTPTFIYQVRDDAMTTPDDVQAIFDGIATAEKKLHWIEGTSARWDGYLEFQRRPEPMLEWFARYMT